MTLIKQFRMIKISKEPLESAKEKNNVEELKIEESFVPNQNDKSKIDQSGI